MKPVIDGTRQSIIEHDGHLLILGGPGSGKTTIALLKAQAVCPKLTPGQEILFVSFSRAAVRQVLTRCRTLLTRRERTLICVKTYHAFCIEVLHSHGRMLSGTMPRFLYPREERTRQAEFAGDWSDEVARLRREESRYCFDAVACGAAELFEQSALIRRLYTNKFPLLIVDEFQDTDDDQWRLVRAFAQDATLACLADADQCIFDYRKNVDPKRLDILRTSIKPVEFDLGGDNHRSPNAGVLAFADAVLENRPLPTTTDVTIRRYQPNAFGTCVHVAVISMFNSLRTAGVSEPTVAVLARSNLLVARMSADISSERRATLQGRKRTLPPIEHTVVWDAEMTIAATAVVASVLEWSSTDAASGVADTLLAAARFYRLKDAMRPSASAKTKARLYEKSAVAVRSGAAPKQKSAKELAKKRQAGIALLGEPVEDWRAVQAALQAIAGFEEIVAESRLLRLLRGRSEVGGLLAERWLATGTYAGAARMLERALDHHMLTAADRDPRGCVLMSIHKSKGKEFDGVIVVEGSHSSPFFDAAREKAPYKASRRLMRVAITRARARVLLIRPVKAVMPLVS